MPTPFPKEFRDDVVEVALHRDAGVTLVHIAKDFGIQVGTLDKRMHQARTVSGEPPDMTTSDNDELKALQKRNRLLEQENEVLRRAAGYFSQANLPPKGSTRSEDSWPPKEPPWWSRVGCSSLLVNRMTAGCTNPCARLSWWQPIVSTDGGSARLADLPRQPMVQRIQQTKSTRQRYAAWACSPR